MKVREREIALEEKRLKEEKEMKEEEEAQKKLAERQKQRGISEDINTDKIESSGEISITLVSDSHQKTAEKQTRHKYELEDAEL